MDVLEQQYSFSIQLIEFYMTPLHAEVMGYCNFVFLFQFHFFHKFHCSFPKMTMIPIDHQLKIYWIWIKIFNNTYAFTIFHEGII